MEAVLSLAILGTTLAILGQIMGTGVDAATEANDLAVARLTASRRLDEILIDVDAGITPPPAADAPVQPADPQSTAVWTHDVQTRSGSMTGVLALTVVVRATDPDTGTPRAEHRLVRWIVDPTYDLKAFADEQEKAREAYREDGGESVPLGGFGA